MAPRRIKLFALVVVLGVVKAADYELCRSKLYHIHYATEGTISSPNFPDAFPTSRICRVVFQTQRRQIHIRSIGDVNTITTNDACTTGSCCDDYVQIFDSGIAVTERLCGDISVNLTTVSSVLTVMFSSGWKVGQGAFQFYFKATAEHVYELCRDNVEINHPSGHVISNRYPAPYVGNKGCVLTLNAEALGGYVTLDIRYFELLEIQDGKDTCNDSLTIYGDNNKLVLPETCGLLPPMVLTVASSVVRFVFHSDTNTGMKGFWITYQVGGKPTTTPRTTTITTFGDVSQGFSTSSTSEDPTPRAITGTIVPSPVTRLSPEPTPPSLQITSYITDSSTETKASPKPATNTGADHVAQTPLSSSQTFISTMRSHITQAMSYSGEVDGSVGTFSTMVSQPETVSSGASPNNTSPGSQIATSIVTSTLSGVTSSQLPSDNQSVTIPLETPALESMHNSASFSITNDGFATMAFGDSSESKIETITLYSQVTNEFPSTCLQLSTMPISYLSSNELETIKSYSVAETSALLDPSTNTTLVPSGSSNTPIPYSSEIKAETPSSESRSNIPSSDYSLLVSTQPTLPSSSVLTTHKTFENLTSEFHTEISAAVPPSVSFTMPTVSKSLSLPYHASQNTLDALASDYVVEDSITIHSSMDLPTTAVAMTSETTIPDIPFAQTTALTTNLSENGLETITSGSHEEISSTLSSPENIQLPSVLSSMTLIAYSSETSVVPQTQTSAIIHSSDLLSVTRVMYTSSLSGYSSENEIRSMTSESVGKTSTVLYSSANSSSTTPGQSQMLNESYLEVIPTSGIVFESASFSPYLQPTVEITPTVSSTLSSSHVSTISPSASDTTETISKPVSTLPFTIKIVSTSSDDISLETDLNVSSSVFPTTIPLTSNLVNSSTPSYVHTFTPLTSSHVSWNGSYESQSSYEITPSSNDVMTQTATYTKTQLPGTPTTVTLPSKDVVPADEQTPAFEREVSTQKIVERNDEYILGAAIGGSFGGLFLLILLILLIVFLLRSRTKVIPVPEARWDWSELP